MLNKVVLGTAQLGLDYGINNSKGQLSRQETLRILYQCKISGIKFLDTAAAYGTSEVIIGELLHTYFEEEDFQITTKFKFTENEDLNSLTKQSLERLRRKSIESQLFHSYLDYKKFLEYPKPEAIKRWGVSVYTNQEISEVIEDPQVKIIQCPFNLLDNESKRGELLKKARSKGIEVQVRSVFLQGLFFMERHNLPEFLEPLKLYLLQIDEVCVKNDLKIQDLALCYCFSKEYIDKVVIGVDSLNQLEQNIQSLNHNIPKEIFEIIDNISVINYSLLNPSNW